MKTTIDAAGRVVIPKTIRSQAGLHAGMQIEIRCRDGRIEIEPADEEVRLEWQAGWLVAVADGDGALTAAQVEQIRPNSYGTTAWTS